MSQIQTQRNPWISDFSASMVVFLVALPLCLGIAIASDVPPIYGILSGIIGGLIVGVFTGSPLQVSGPAAGLAVLVFELVQQYGFPALGLFVFASGAIQFACGKFGLGQWFRAVSPSVIHGMLTGIGILIAASQFHVMVDDTPKGSGLNNLLSLPDSIWKGMIAIDGATHHLAALVGVTTIVGIILWSRFAPKQLKMIPAPLLAVGLVTIVVDWLNLPIKFVDLPANVMAAFSTPGTFLTQLHLLKDANVWVDIVGIAFIASAETLLSASAVEKMSTTKVLYDKELAAQGLGNMLCGVMGSLPITGVIVRSAANIQAGAATQWSTIMHGTWLLLFVLFAQPLLKIIPTSALAAILVYTGYKLMNFSVIKTLRQHGRIEVAIYIVTLSTIVLEDLLTGVLLGLFLSFAKLVYVFSKLSIHQVQDTEDSRIHLYLEGAATFIRLPQLTAAIDQLPPGAKVLVHINKLSYIDHACLELFEAWENSHQSDGGDIEIAWTNSPHQKPSPKQNGSLSH